MEVLMKRIVIVLLLVLFTVVSLSAAVVANPGKPLKGEWNFKYQEQWRIKGYGDEPMALVQKFVILDNGDIYLFDRRHFKFFVLDKNGKPKFSFGTKGEGPGEIKYMLGFYLVDNELVVSDLGKVIYFNLEGKFENSVPTSSTIGVAPLLFIDKNHLIKTRLALNSGLNAAPEALEIFDLAAKTTSYLAGDPVPDNKKSTNQGVMVMINIGNSELERKPGFVVGKFGDKILWGKNDTYLVKACDFSGKELFAFSLEGRKQKKITPECKELIVSRMTFRTQGGPSEEEIKKRMVKSFPDESTYFSQLEPGHDGLIYVYTSDAVRENGQEIDIFSSSGQYLYHADIALSAADRIVANGVVFKGDFLYLAVEEASGELSFRKYSIQHPAEGHLH
jgi:hypothetical protein